MPLSFVLSAAAEPTFSSSCIAMAIATPPTAAARADGAMGRAGRFLLLRVSLAFLHCVNRILGRDVRRIHAGQTGNFPRLHVGVGRGLRFCEVRAAPGATPPEFTASSYMTWFKYERVSLSTRYPLCTMRRAMMRDVDVALVARPQAGHMATYSVPNRIGRVFGHAVASLRPQAGRRRTGKVFHDTVPVTTGGHIRAPRVPSASDDTLATLSRFQALQPLPVQGWIEGRVHLHPGTSGAAISTQRVLLHAVTIQVTIPTVLSWLPFGSTSTMFVDSVLSVPVPPLGTLRWFRPPQPPPWAGGLAGAVQLHAGLAGGNVSAPPPKRLLITRDRMRLGMRQPHPEGRIAASLELPSDTAIIKHIVETTATLAPFCQPFTDPAAGGV
jgi:hypothetical protein